MRRKRSITLLEVILATVLLGILLTGLFQTFHQGLKKNIAARDLKQRVLQLELFQQKLKNLFASQQGIWIDVHPAASLSALFVEYEIKADPDFEMCGSLEGMLYLNSQKELCWVSWSENGGERIETLLDQVDSFNCRLFDTKKAAWSQTWPKKKGSDPAMVGIDLTWRGKEIPFVFFLKEGSQTITYTGPT